MRNRILTLIAIAVVSVSIIGGTLANDGPVDTPSTGEEPVGTVTIPTPVWEETPVVLEIRQLPSTGAGTTAREEVRSEHDYTTVHAYCWKFVSGVWYYREDTTYWRHSWWGSSHYAAWTSRYDGGRCYIS